MHDSVRAGVANGEVEARAVNACTAALHADDALLRSLKKMKVCVGRRLSAESSFFRNASIFELGFHSKRRLQIKYVTIIVGTLLIGDHQIPFIADLVDKRSGILAECVYSMNNDRIVSFFSDIKVRISNHIQN